MGLVNDAYENWHKVFGNNGHWAFWEFVNGGEPYSPNLYLVKPDEERRLKLLIGPYHVAIIKAYKIRRDMDSRRT
jgi:hypothetical protein